MTTLNYKKLILVIVLPPFDHGASYEEDVWDIYWFEKNLQGEQTKKRLIIVFVKRSPPSASRTSRDLPRRSHTTHEWTGACPVVAVYNDAVTKLISYKYDAWGNFSAINHTTEIPASVYNNPFRYRGYYYDADLGLYYLNTRYYDSNTGRFINADEVMSGVNGSLQGFNLYAYCFNNPIMHTDYTGNWPSWKSIKKWVNDKYEIWKEESFIYNVITQNITADFGVGIGIGGEIKVGKANISAISRGDAIGIETNGIDTKQGRHGKSSFSAGIGGYYVGAEWKTYESYDGTAYERTQSVPEAGWTIGGEV